MFKDIFVVLSDNWDVVIYIMLDKSTRKILFRIICGARTIHTPQLQMNNIGERHISSIPKVSGAIQESPSAAMTNDGLLSIEQNNRRSVLKEQNAVVL